MLNEKIKNKTYSTNNTENIPIGDCIAKAIRQALTNSRHDWQYCFLERGGDSGEHYLTAEEILNASEHLACHLRAIIPVSNPVILSLEHGPNFLISLIACFFANRIVIPMPVPRFELHIARAEHILKITGNAYILTKNNYFNLFNSGTLPSLIQNRFIDFEILMNSPYDKNSASQTQNKRPTPNTPVVIQFTSGSTNLPKGVLISAENIIDNQYQVARKWNFTPNKTLVTWLPYFHDMGLFGGLLYPLLSGMKIVQMDPLHFIQKPVRWLRAMDKFKAHISGGPAFAFELCNELDNHTLFTDFDFSNWEVAFCGADYVPTKTLQEFRQKFITQHLKPQSVIPVYGLAEATLFVAGQPNLNSDNINPYSGNLTEGCYLGEKTINNIFISDTNNNNRLSDGEIGEICVVSRSVSKGYYNHQSPHDNEVLRTGDLGLIKNNHLYICGRLKDIIIVNGQNISPSNIEQIATSICDLLNPHATAAFQSPTGGVILLLEAKKGVSEKFPDTTQLRSSIASRLQQKLGFSPELIKFLKRGELMRTSSGKVQRSLISKYFSQGHHFKEVKDDNN